MSNGNSSNPSETDWDALRAMADEDIDYSDIPPLPERFFKEAQFVGKDGRVTVSARLSHDLARWLARQPDSEEVISAALEEFRRRRSA